MLIRSGEIPSPGQTSIDKTNDCAMKSEQGALVRDSDPPSCHSVHKTTGDRWRAPARHIWALLGRKQATKFLDPPPMAKNRPFCRFGRRTPRVTSRPLDHGSTWYLRGRHLHSPALPDTNRVGRGLIPRRGRRLIVAGAVFDQRVDNFQAGSTSSAAYISVNK